MKDILLQIINLDTSYNKSATRYLYKTHLDLWGEILEKTSFLPNSAKPKQRVWHILNDCYFRPICPITGEFVKWNECLYFTTSSRRAKQILKHQNGDYINGHSAENNEKRKQGNIAAVNNGRKYRSKETYTVEQKEKTKQTYLKNFGVDHPSKNKDFRKRLYDIKVEKGTITPKHLRSSKRLYYEAVGKFTGESWQNNFDQINPTRLNRSQYDLDHIYSKHQGFKDNIPPYIIGHWTNLRMLSKSENSSKGSRCDKTSEQLFEDFFKNNR